jgi:hypothetical protein
VGDWFLQPDPATPGRQVWVYDKNAPSPGRQPAVTMIHPVVYPTPRDEPVVGDVGDWIDPNAPDPTPDEITHREHPDYVDPWFGS